MGEFIITGLIVLAWCIVAVLAALADGTPGAGASAAVLTIAFLLLTFLMEFAVAEYIGRWPIRAQRGSKRG